MSGLPNNANVALACAKRKVFNIYHSTLQTADDNLLGKIWNIILGLNSDPLFSGPYVRPTAKGDGDMQW